MRANPDFQFDTSYEDAEGYEHDIRVLYEYSPAEYNWPATKDIVGAYYEDAGDILDDIPDAAQKRLQDEAREHYSYLCERMQAMREDAAEARAEAQREARIEYERDQRATHASLVRDGDL